MSFRAVLMLKLILTLLGCNKPPKVTSSGTALGPFTLEKIVTVLNEGKFQEFFVEQSGG